MLKSFDDFLKDTQGQADELIETMLVSPPPGDMGDLIIHVLQVSKRYSDLQLRLYHDWLSKQLSNDE